MTVEFAQPRGPAAQVSFAGLARLNGAVGFLSSQTEEYAMLSLGALQERLTPSFHWNQFRLLATGDAFPVAFAHWAWMDRAALDRVSAGQPLSREEWQSGEIAVLLDVIALADWEEKILQDLRRTVFGPDRPVYRLRWRDGLPEVEALAGETDA